MQFWQQITELLPQLIDNDWAVFLFVVLEESGPGLVLPGDMVKVLSGYRVAEGKASLLWVLLLFEAATLVGASILYWLAARGGRPLLYRCAPIFRFDQARLDRLEDLVRRRGVVAILFGRMVPGPRIPLVVMAGVLGLPYLKLLPALAVGSLVYILPWVLLGMWTGPQALATLGRIELPLRAVLTVALFVALSAILWVVYRRAARTLTSGPTTFAFKIETAALAGSLATFEMILGVNVALFILGALGVGLPEEGLVRLIERGAPLFTEGSVSRFFMHLTFVLIVGNLCCAFAYALMADPLLPGPAWLRGLLFAPVPLVVSQLALMPWLGAGPFGLDLGVGWAPLVGEVFRNALFGVSLGVSYALFKAARQAPRMVAATAGG